jgi:hypothetical protein
MKGNHLLFVYNADSDIFSTVTDFVHKIVAPSTYKCTLCALTYGNVSIKKDWSSFLEGIKMDKEFLHKNEFAQKYKMDITVPAIFYIKDGKFETIVRAAELNRTDNLDKLIELMKRWLAQSKIEMQ